MKNPPDFVMYVIMVKAPGKKNFDPLRDCEGSAEGFISRKAARNTLARFQRRYGKKNAYVQQYGPYS